MISLASKHLQGERGVGACLQAMIILNRANDLRDDFLYLALGDDGLRGRCDSWNGFGVSTGEALVLGQGGGLDDQRFAARSTAYCGGLRVAEAFRQ